MKKSFRSQWWLSGQLSWSCRHMRDSTGYPPSPPSIWSSPPCTCHSLARPGWLRSNWSPWSLQIPWSCTLLRRVMVWALLELASGTSVSISLYKIIKKIIHWISKALCFFSEYRRQGFFYHLATSMAHVSGFAGQWNWSHGHDQRSWYSPPTYSSNF